MFAYHPKRCKHELRGIMEKITTRSRLAGPVFPFLAQQCLALKPNKSNNSWMKYNPIMKPINQGDDFIVWKVLHSYLNMFTGLGHNDTI